MNYDIEIESDLSYSIGDEGPVTAALERTSVVRSTLTPRRFRASVEKTRLEIDALARQVYAAAAGLPPSWIRAWSDFIFAWGSFLNDYPPERDALSSMFTFQGTAMPRLASFTRLAGQWRQSLNLVRGGR